MEKWMRMMVQVGILKACELPTFHAIRCLPLFVV